MIWNAVVRLGRLVRKSDFQQRRTFYTPGVKVAILGANGGVGQPLSLMLKQSSLFAEVALYDKSTTRGLAAELNHIDTTNIAVPYEGKKGLECALKGAKIVVMVASSNNNSFEENGSIVCDLSKACAEHAPNALLAVATHPVNSMLPIACEMYKRTILSVDPRRMFGVTTLDTVRGSTFVSEVLQISPDCVQVPVIGGHSPNSLVPVLSHIKPCIDLTTEETVRITRAIQEAGCESDRGKPKPRTSTLSGAFAIARFVTALAKGLAGQAGVVECSYVMSNVIPTISYLSTQVELGPDGVQKNLGVPEITDYECCLMETALPFIKSDILKGEEFTAKSQK